MGRQGSTVRLLVGALVATVSATVGCRAATTDTAAAAMAASAGTEPGVERVRLIDGQVVAGRVTATNPRTPYGCLPLVEGGDDHNAAGAEDELDEVETATRAAARPVSRRSGDTIGLTVEDPATQDAIDGANTLGTIGIAVGAVSLLTSASTLILSGALRARTRPASADAASLVGDWPGSVRVRKGR